MKTIGMIGGLSWHSSLQMYEYINNCIAKELGEFNCAEMVLVNVNLQDIFVTRKDEQEQVLLEAARKLDRAGCDFYIICSTPCTGTPLSSMHMSKRLCFISRTQQLTLFSPGA